MKRWLFSVHVGSTSSKVAYGSCAQYLIRAVVISLGRIRAYFQGLDCAECLPRKGGRGAIRNVMSSRKYLAKNIVITNLEVTAGKCRFLCIMIINYWGMNQEQDPSGPLLLLRSHAQTLVPVASNSLWISQH